MAAEVHLLALRFDTNDALGITVRQREEFHFPGATAHATNVVRENQEFDFVITIVKMKKNRVPFRDSHFLSHFFLHGGIA